MLRGMVALSLVGAGIVALVTAAFIPFSTQNEAGADSSNAKMMTATENSQQHKSKTPESADDLYPVIKERWSGPDITTITNELEASSKAGFGVKFPTQMPSSDYKLQLAIVNRETGEDNKYVFLYYSEKPITNEMTFNQFWEQGGISVTYHKNFAMVRNDFPESVGSMNYGEMNPSFSNLTAMVEAVKDSGMNAYETTINGHQASAIADVHREFQGFPVHDPAQVDFIVGNTHITLQGYKDTDELIRIAESMPFDD